MTDQHGTARTRAVTRKLCHHAGESGCSLPGRFLTKQDTRRLAEMVSNDLAKHVPIAEECHVVPTLLAKSLMLTHG